SEAQQDEDRQREADPTHAALHLLLLSHRLRAASCRPQSHAPSGFPQAHHRSRALPLVDIALASRARMGSTPIATSAAITPSSARSPPHGMPAPEKTRKRISPKTAPVRRNAHSTGTEAPAASCPSLNRSRR